MAAALILVPLNGFQLLDLVPRSEQFAAQEAAASNEASIVQSAMVWISQTRQTIRSTVGGFALVNGYGLFRTMTKTRPELLVEAVVMASPCSATDSNTNHPPTVTP